MSFHSSKRHKDVLQIMNTPPPLLVPLLCLNEHCDLEDSTNVFWVNLQLIKVVHRGVIRSAELPVSL